MLRIPFEVLEFGLECFKSFSNGSNLHSDASNPFQRVTISIRMLRIHLNVSNLHSNALNPVRIIQICIRMLRIPFEALEFGLECFEFLSKG